MSTILLPPKMTESPPPGVPLGIWVLERTERAVEQIHDRLLRATRALIQDGVPYAVVGGKAVQAWVGTVDAAAIRNTKDVDILLRREDIPAATAALAKAGFIYRHVKSIDMFLDGPNAKARDAVHVVFAGEKVRPEDPVPAPDVKDNYFVDPYHVIRLEALVRMKLTSFRDKDRTHLRDFIDVGLVDSDWPRRLPEPLNDRLQQLLDTPEG
jgi:hypothetical protein